MIEEITVKDVATYDENGIIIKDLKRINYIYGANGTGKTTLSRFLDMPDNAEFTKCVIKWENDIQIGTYVYNKEFREKNFGESDIAGIFTLGEATKEQIDEIDEKKTELEQIEKSIIAAKKTIEGLQIQIEDENNDFKEAIWKDTYKNNEMKFKEAFVGFQRKEAFMNKILGISLPIENVIDRDEVEERAKMILNEQPKYMSRYPLLDALALLEVERSDIWTKCITGRADMPISSLINFLKNGDWVNQGRKYISLTNQCPFCQKNTIDNDFRQQLEQFFDKEFEGNVEEIAKQKSLYMQLKENITQQISELVEQGLINKTGKTVDSLLASYVKILDLNINRMNEKIIEPSKKIELEESIKYIENINSIINEKNSEIDKNNNLADNYRIERDKLISDIWILLAKENKAIIENHKSKITGYNKGIYETSKKEKSFESKKRQLEYEIREKNRQITSVQPAVDEINRILTNYGFSNFTIQRSPVNQNFYQIKRPNGKLVEATLSEGEITFITFLYFLQWIKGGKNEEDVSKDRIVVIDDPISSLDSNVLFIVSSLLKDVVYKVLDGSSTIKQIFVLTHNVYFHKELSFIGQGNNPNKEVNYWIIRKKNEITNIQAYGMENPIASSYELLWKELKEVDSNSVMTIQNVMRRIIENYFKILGKYKDEALINKFPDYESREVCRSLLSWINDGSHCMPDDLFVEAMDDTLERYQEVFKKIFEYTNHIEHYNMMMDIETMVS